MFRKILIANRGEIAVRIVRACRELGIATVAVYSEVDRGALHVRLADEAFPCGPARASESYLAGEKLLRIAERAGAEAVHPGYGFLSENGDFAQACADRGLVFIGPAPEVLRAMGDKVTSRRIVSAAGVPVVPGSSEARGDREIAADALELGLPVIVKASGGGGGRGMRVVSEQKDLLPAIERARSEAASAFANDAVYVEKYLDRPRHIEVQLLADGHGNAIHLFERECSVQRRHQKLLEEAPANIDAERREALASMALKVARAVDYQGAGTVEFLMESGAASGVASGAASKDDFYFLEMNTRIQVEHPVTEAVTCVDIVKQMIRIAAGEPLEISQDQIELRGHAVEARIYAEDPDRGFLPSPGRIRVFRPPAGAGIRVDAGVQAGDTVTPNYDAMLAKLVVWGSDRREALARLDSALAEFAVSGIRTSIPFHRRLLRHAAFAEGEYDTGVVADSMAEPDAVSDEPGLLRLAVALTAIARFDAGQPLAAIRPETRAKRTQTGDSELSVVVARTSNGNGEAQEGSREFVAEIDGESLRLDVSRSEAGAYSLIADGRQWEALLVETRPGRFEVVLGGSRFRLQARDAEEHG
jgi:acetyl-CoA carboxylase biotin carboxylase subunit